MISGLDEMAAFVAVAEHGSVAAAAEALQIDAGELDRRLGSLEQRMGTSLLAGRGEAVHLTDAGRVYFERAARVVRDALAAEQMVQRMQRAPAGTLRLTAPNLFGESYLAPIVLQFMERYPAVEVDLLLTDRSVDLVREGYDLAIRISLPDDAAVQARLLGPVARYLVASPAYLDRRGRPREPADLEQHDCIVIGSRHDRGVWRLIGPDGPLELPVTGRLAVNSVQLARDAALAGLGVASLPSFVSGEAVNDGRLVALLGGWSQATATLHAVFPSSHPLDPNVRAFLELVHDLVTPEPPWLITRP